MHGTLKTWILLLGAALAGAVAATCSKPGGGGDVPPPPDASIEERDDAGVPVRSERCEVDLERFLNRSANGFSRAKRVEGPDDLVGGPNARGKPGDYLLANDKIRVIIQGIDRHIGPQPYGATILDADLVRSGPGRDQFGEIGLFYNLGRTIDPTLLEVLAAGGPGEPAVVAMTGKDTVHDYLRVKNALSTQGGAPAINAERPVPVRLTNYFILNPGEQRVRYLTAFCNESDKEEVLLVGDLADPGFAVEFFNGQSCTGGFGYGGLCKGLDRMSWFGYQGDGVAYGYAPYKTSAPTQPEPNNAMMTLSFVSGSLIGTSGLTGLSEWFDPNLEHRSGEMRIAAREARVVARDFVVGRDLGEVASVIATFRNAATGTGTGTLSGTVNSGGKPVAKARVSVTRDNEVSAVFVTDEQGRFQGRLTEGSYLVSAWFEGSIPTEAQVARLRRDVPVELAFDLVAPRKLTVSVVDTDGHPLPAKVTVVCATGACPAPRKQQIRFTDTNFDPTPDNVQLIGFVPPTGTATFDLPPDQYNVLVSRGPEYSIHPNGYPTTPGVGVDLRTADGTVNATLARVLSTPGWASADFHVHAVDSPDSFVDNLSRVLTFVAEGVDLLVSSDHDYVTDYAPFIKELGAEHLISTLSGEEISPTDFGHYIAFPLTPDKDDLLTAGAIDWGGGRGPTLTVAEIFAEARKLGARTIQINHPRGLLGSFTLLRADTDTLMTHADPTNYGMAVQPGSTPGDTKLLSADFNSLEIYNSGTDELEPDLARPHLNDWFTFLSRGMKIAATGNSDTHQRWAAAAGYWRTYVQVPDDDPSRIDPFAISHGVNALRAVATDGPFVQVRAVRVDSTGKPTSAEVGIGETLAPSKDDVLVTVEAQVPEYLDITGVELYMHSPADDGGCPMDPTSAQALTTRVACDGVTNKNWPASSIAASQKVTLTAANLVPVASVGGVTYRRYETKTTFRLPAPKTDNWIVATVQGSKSNFPLTLYKKAKPFALANPVFVDADGGGYDKPPFRRMPTTREYTAPAQKQPPRPLTPEDLVKAWPYHRHGAGVE